MRKFNDFELKMLREQTYVLFTAEEFEELARGTLRVKLIHHAEKCINAYKSYLSKPVSRDELNEKWISKEYFEKVFSRLNNMIVYIQQSLFRKGFMTKEEFQKISHEVIAEEWLHVCKDCKHEFPSCPAENMKFAFDIYSDLEGELADKIIACLDFEKKEVENAPREEAGK